MALSVKVTGAKELRRQIRNAQRDDLKKALKEANKAAAEVVAKEAKAKTVPVLSGALKSSIRALGSQTKGQVAAGLRKTNRYAGIQHFGNPGHNIEPNPYLYDARDNRIKQVRDQYVEEMNKLAKKVSTRG